MELPPGFVLPPRLSLNDVVPANGGVARGKAPHAVEGGAPKKGQPWTEEEHRLFLLGLQQLGKGNWRGISRQYVTSRTPTQIASHAQKYSLRTSGVTKRRSRFSALEEQQAQLAAAGGKANTSLAQAAANSAHALPLLASAVSTAMMFAWPLLPPPQGLQLGPLQAGASAAPTAPATPAEASVSSGSSTVLSTSQPSSPDAGTASGGSQQQTQQEQQQQQQQQLPTPQQPRPQRHPDSNPQLQPVRVCRPTARLAGRDSSRNGGTGSEGGGGQLPEQGERVATPPAGGARLQHSASSAFRALVSACGAAATCA
jgi:SHAQKYF class myb-like DNA-binding protein